MRHSGPNGGEDISVARRLSDLESGQQALKAKGEILERKQRAAFRESGIMLAEVRDVKNRISRVHNELTAMHKELFGIRDTLVELAGKQRKVYR